MMSDELGHAQFAVTIVVTARTALIGANQHLFRRTWVISASAGALANGLDPAMPTWRSARKRGIAHDRMGMIPRARSDPTR
jgi:hypothetical protein